MKPTPEDIETEAQLKAKENIFDQWEDVHNDLLIMDGITTLVTVVSQSEWTPQIVSNLEQFGYEIIFSNSSFTIYRIPLQEFGDKEELMLLREMTQTDSEISDFEAVQVVLYGEYPYRKEKNA